MAIVLNLDGQEIIKALNDACQRPSKNLTIPTISIVDQDLCPNPPQEPEHSNRPRIGHQAVLERNPIRTTMLISPPSEDAAALADWSSAQAIDGARKAARSCASAYAQGLQACSLFSQDQISQAKEMTLFVMETFFAAAKNVLAAKDEPPPAELSGRVAAFQDACELAGQDPNLAWKGALRDTLIDLPVRQAMAILEASSVEFSVKQSFQHAVWSGRADSIDHTFTLHKNGSFNSRSYASCDSASALSDLILTPKTDRDFGLEHAFHQHFATTPDGEIHGFSNIVIWARQVKAHGEAIAISSQSGPGREPVRKLSL